MARQTITDQKRKGSASARNTAAVPAPPTSAHPAGQQIIDPPHEPTTGLLLDTRRQRLGAR